MNKKLTKIIALLLALTMVLAFAACGKDQGNDTTAEPGSEDVNAEAVNGNPKEADGLKDPYADKTHAEISDDLYEKVLGEFDEAYAKAFDAETVSERFALMAIAEAKLLESGVMLPSTANGGMYAISKIAPYTVTPCLWGTDEYRFNNLVIVDGDSAIKTAERDELKALWGETKGTGTYAAKVKEYLTDKGYSFTDVYERGYTSDPQTWDAFNTYRQADSEAIVNTYAGLLEYNIENEQVPALAEALPTVSEDGLTYTFKIRQGVNWVDSQGKVLEPVTAKSFVAGMRHMLDAQGGLEYLVSGIIKNAAEYMDGTITDFEEVGVKAVDDYTLEYTLEEPCTYFLTMFGYNIFAPLCEVQFQAKGGKFGVDEFAEIKDTDAYTYGKTPDDIGYCGAYLVTSNTPENSIVFEANPEFYDKDGMNITKIVWTYIDGKNPTAAYDFFKEGKFSAANLNTQALEKCKTDGLFDEYAYVTATDATSFPMFLNLYRAQYGNFDDASVAPTTFSDVEKLRANIAMQNHNFRLAITTALDRGAYNATVNGDDLKLTSLVNSYTPGNFVSLAEEVTVKINDADKTYAAGTYYGQIMQDQIDADGVKIKVWDPEAESGNGSSAGFDGWYNPEYAKEMLAKAVEELKEEGVEISAENPIKLELPYYDINETYTQRENALKQSIEASLEGQVEIVLVKTGGSDAMNWYNAGYYPETGDTMNYNLVDVCGWGPDFGDPQTYLDTMLGQPGGMAKNIGLY
ncbi:MAG: peptide ABC transporter substrate-binding protein [Clostridia bacterium]|nr:peptide ABC transporter substrate-binding protein [Clostridia bacterium]